MLPLLVQHYLLIWRKALSSKNSINLLQAELFPKKALLTLKRLIASWSLIASIMILAVVMSQYQLNKSSAELTVQKKTKAKQDNELAILEKKVRQNKPAYQLVKKLATIKLLMANKQAIYKELTNPNTTYVAGFAKAMNDLSNMHSANISLQKVVINHNEMMFSGMARTPEAVPTWLALFESSTVLSGKAFSHFSMEENDSNFTDFVVSTTSNEVKK